MKIIKEDFGVIDGKNIYKFVLSNSNRLKVEIINYGGIIVSLLVPDRDGKFDDVVLGHETLDEYKNSSSYFGAIVGRHANRIQDAEFQINDTIFNLAKNNGNNHLHGGLKGFDKVVWDYELDNKREVEVLILKYISIDGEENYPGNLEVVVKYSLSEDNQLKIEYLAKSDKDTVVNLTNHSYFNLGGIESKNILEHKLMINANQFTPVNSSGVPTGEIKGVESHCVMDFREMKEIVEGLKSYDENIVLGNGYDHNWILNVNGLDPQLAAKLYEPKSGRTMEVFTTKPGMQLYTGNYLNNSIIGKKYKKYNKWQGLCFETQYFPNSLKHKHFPSAILKKDEKYQHTTIFKFGCI